MFTGLIEATSPILNIQNTKQVTSFEIENTKFNDLDIGDSIAINGVCLTVTKLKEHSFSVDVINETKRLTNLSQVKEGDLLNLERAMRLSDRLGGHLVSGHVEGTGKVIDIAKDGVALVLKLECHESLMKFMVERGSVTLDGISLTLFAVDHKQNTITVNIIPETQKETNIIYRTHGDAVNIETDMIIKHVEHLMTNGKVGELHV